MGACCSKNAAGKDVDIRVPANFDSAENKKRHANTPLTTKVIAVESRAQPLLASRPVPSEPTLNDQRLISAIDSAIYHDSTAHTAISNSYIPVNTMQSMSIPAPLIVESAPSTSTKLTLAQTSSNATVLFDYSTVPATGGITLNDLRARGQYTEPASPRSPLPSAPQHTKTTPPTSKDDRNVQALPIKIDYSSFPKTGGYTLNQINDIQQKREQQVKDEVEEISDLLFQHKQPILAATAPSSIPPSTPLSSLPAPASLLPSSSSSSTPVLLTYPQSAADTASLAPHRTQYVKSAFRSTLPSHPHIHAATSPTSTASSMQSSTPTSVMTHVEQTSLPPHRTQYVSTSSKSTTPKSQRRHVNDHDSGVQEKRIVNVDDIPLPAPTDLPSSLLSTLPSPPPSSASDAAPTALTPHRTQYISAPFVSTLPRELDTTTPLSSPTSTTHAEVTSLSLTPPPVMKMMTPHESLPPHRTQYITPKSQKRTLHMDSENASPSAPITPSSHITGAPLKPLTYNTAPHRTQYVYTRTTTPRSQTKSFTTAA